MWDDGDPYDYEPGEEGESREAERLILGFSVFLLVTVLGVLALYWAIVA